MIMADLYTLTDAVIPTRARGVNIDVQKWLSTLPSVPLDADGRSGAKAYTVPDGVSAKASIRHLRAAARILNLKVRAHVENLTVVFTLSRVKTK
jgi:hypothetical protein